ncbi:MAG: hypothetical protein ACRC8S_22870 [Fimbriiglobus sp.]
MKHPCYTDVYLAVQTVLETRYLQHGELRSLPIWASLPDEFQTLLNRVMPLSELLAAIRALRQPHIPEGISFDTPAYVQVLLGVTFFAYQRNRLDREAVLTKGFFYTDSYICGLDPVPFLELRDDRPLDDELQIHLLFAPYIPHAEAFLNTWGFE